MKKFVKLQWTACYRGNTTTVGDRIGRRVGIGIALLISSATHKWASAAAVRWRRAIISTVFASYV
jgi:hypothetical protein